VRPLTAIAISLIIVSVSFGIGRVVLPFNLPFFEYTPTESPSPVPVNIRSTAFTGMLKYTEANNKYYLVTASSEAIMLSAPANIELSKLIDRRIFATGKYNEDTRTLVINDALDLEILPRKNRSCSYNDTYTHYNSTPQSDDYACTCGKRAAKSHEYTIVVSIVKGFPCFGL